MAEAVGGQSAEISQAGEEADRGLEDPVLPHLLHDLVAATQGPNAVPEGEPLAGRIPVSVSHPQRIEHLLLNEGVIALPADSLNHQPRQHRTHIRVLVSRAWREEELDRLK